MAFIIDAAQQRDKWIDLVGRITIIGWFLTTAVSIATSFPALASDGNLPKIAAKGLLCAFYILAIWLTLIRSKPVARAKGWQPRFSAIMGTNLFTFGISFWTIRADLSDSLYVLSASLILIGYLFSFYSLVHLGRSFSIMAQARKLVTDGPYSIVRHPLYLGEFVAFLGVFIQYASITAALLLIAQSAFQLQRMLNEENVLAETFQPEYDRYVRRTKRLMPGVW
jgi:protein-S-isoprenylcysteine O-methyltransferase Ste14